LESCPKIALGRSYARLSYMLTSFQLILSEMIFLFKSSCYKSIRFYKEMLYTESIDRWVRMFINFYKIFNKIRKKRERDRKKINCNTTFLLNLCEKNFFQNFEVCHNKRFLEPFFISFLFIIFLIKLNILNKTILATNSCHIISLLLIYTSQVCPAALFTDTSDITSQIRVNLARGWFHDIFYHQQLERGKREKEG